MADEEAPLVLETPGGLSVSFHGRLLYSGREPASLAARVAGSCDRGPSRLLLVPSPLLWYGVAELLAAMGQGSALLCVEAEGALAELSRSRMPADLAAEGRLAFLEGPSFEEAIAAAEELGDFRACSLVSLSGGTSLHAEVYKAMAAALNARFQAEWRNRAALMVLGRRWARNIFDNIAALPEIRPEAMPRFPGPAVVCGAGPSLEEALPLLKRLRSAGGSPAILACDTALGTLLAAGIEADLVVCLEGQAHNLGDFTCLGERPIALAADLSSHPATFRAVPGRKHLSLVRITRSPFLDRVASALAAAGIPFLELPPLGSVGVHAFRMARSLASGPILAVGLDFSFEPGKTHARGCPSLLAEELSLSRLRRWPKQYAASFRERTMRTGGLLSDPILLSYAALLAEGASDARRAGAELYDLRGRGPSIGCRRVSFAEAEEIILRSAAEKSHSLAAPGTAAPAASPSASGDAARGAALRLLRGEEERLAALRAAMHGSKSLGKEDFRALVVDSDYLYWGFPDQARARERELPQDFMNRLVPEAEYWAFRIEALIASLE
jgi:hypothetical protein